MNTKQRTEWLAAVGACLPACEIRPMAAAAAALDAAAPGRWEASVNGRDLYSVGLRFFGTGPYAPWREACAEAFSLELQDGPAAPRPGFAWLSAAWNLKTGAWTALRLAGENGGVKLKPGQALAWDFKPDGGEPARRLLKPAAFKAGMFHEPALDRALEEFARLCPLATLSVEDPGWALRFAQSLRWPLFARSDLSAAFTPYSSQLALFLLDRSVTELSFDGEALWAHFAG